MVFLVQADRIIQAAILQLVGMQLAALFTRELFQAQKIWVTRQKVLMLRKGYT